MRPSGTGASVRWTPVGGGTGGTGLCSVVVRPLVRRGPYRWINHPNYLVVIAEIAVLPLVFGLWRVALIFSALNAIALAVRIRAENRALGRSQ